MIDWKQKGREAADILFSFKSVVLVLLVLDNPSTQVELLREHFDDLLSVARWTAHWMHCADEPTLVKFEAEVMTLLVEGFRERLIEHRYRECAKHEHGAG